MTEEERRAESQELIDKFEADIKEIDELLADENLKESKRKKLEKKRERRENGLHYNRMSLEDPEYGEKIRKKFEEESVFHGISKGLEKTSTSMKATGDSMQNAGGSMMKQGCLITLWVFAFPIMIPIWIIKKAFFDKKK